MFQMGCSPNDDMCEEIESPAHEVTLSAFEMLETEVTEAQYEAVEKANPACEPGSGLGSDSPVECVTWGDAAGYCNRLGGRLPTEAEWEYAARSGTTTRFYCGDDKSCLDEIAWWGQNSGSKKHPVKQKVPNAWGLHDMLGNISEWTQDWKSEDYYSFSPPQDPRGPDTGLLKIVRGGSYKVLEWQFMRVSRRYHGDGTGFAAKTLGFRCVK
jgi:formylglycine-generating enzyme required for sulfatase activity